MLNVNYGSVIGLIKDVQYQKEIDVNAEIERLKEEIGYGVEALFEQLDDLEEFLSSMQAKDDLSEQEYAREFDERIHELI